MRILFVTSGFPPHAKWGTEFYTHQLALGLVERGHEVAVMHPLPSEGPRAGILERDEREGLAVYLVHVATDRKKRLEASYTNASVEAAFHRVLVELSPDVVHFTYLVWGLSVRMPAICKAYGLPTVVTLTDYGLLCHRGQMFDWRLERCQGPHPAAVCARCIRTPSRYDAPGLLRMGRKLAVEAAAGLGGLGRAVVEGDVLARERAVRGAIEATDLFIAPTRVVQSAFERAGIPREKLVHETYAIRGESLLNGREGLERGNARIKRFGYLGQFMPHKGVHTLVEAVSVLETRLPESVEPWEVWFYGEGGAGRHRRYAAEVLTRASRSSRIFVCPPFSPYAIGRVLAGLDAVVLPSAWDENAPLTALQARAAGVPVVASDVEGIAEVVQDGVHGRLFPPGDSAALADLMREVILGKLSRLQPSLPVSYADHVARMIGIYQHLGAQSAARARRSTVAAQA
jgi:glycosyltransferase involved in cell wall biosynthesis